MDKLNLCIDAGHGGRSPGAVVGRSIEEHIVLSVALRLEYVLKAIGWPVDITMTRSGDYNVSHPERGQISQQSKADLVLSLHANAATFRARGLMAFYWPANEAGHQVADCIQRSAPWALSTRARRQPYPADPIAWPRVRYVLSHHQATAALVELGFLTNVLDAAALDSPDVGREIMPCLLAGIARAITLKRCGKL